MADLKLTINANYEQASKAFKDLAQESEATREKIEKFSNAFKSEQLDKFIDKQKLLEASLTGTRGEVSAMTAAQKNYEKEIEKLIKSGLDPESDAIKRLRDEHDKLADKIQKTNDLQKAQNDLMGKAEKSALGMLAAIGASAAAVGVATQKMAEAGDQYAKTARIIGMTAETFQELEYAAKMSGIDNLDSSLQKLNKAVAEIKSGTGTLTAYLKENDQQLLTHLQNVNSNEEAFNLLMDAIGKAPDEFSRAELAQAAFGESGQNLILLAHEGAEGIAALREEAQRYGIISNEAAANSEAFLDAQERLKSSVSGVSNELTAKLLPGLTESMTKLADFIAGIDNWDEILSTVEYALIGVTSGLIAFLAVAKGSTIIAALTTAFRALTAAIASNPFGAIAVVITSVLIPALIALYKNWDTVQTYLEQGIARIQYAFSWLGSVIKEGLVVAFNTVKSAAVSLVDFIYGNIIRAVGNLLEVMGKLPFVGDLFLEASRKVSALGNAIGNLAEETVLPKPNLPFLRQAYKVVQSLAA
jgi:Flp pilus assembly pilin Flp